MAGYHVLVLLHFIIILNLSKDIKLLFNHISNIKHNDICFFSLHKCSMTVNTLITCEFLGDKIMPFLLVNPAPGSVLEWKRGSVRTSSQKLGDPTHSAVAEP